MDWHSAIPSRAWHSRPLVPSFASSCCLRTASALSLSTQPTPCTRARTSPHLHDLIHGMPLWMSRGLNVTMWIGGYNLAPHIYVDYGSIY